MLNRLLLNTVSQEFINENVNSDIASLILKGISIDGVEMVALIGQIESKRRSRHKLPTWFQTPNIYYPNKLNIEQTSSEITAKYKASLLSGSSILDLTGGFGIDSFYFSKRFDRVTHCEINEDLSHIVNHNYEQLQVENIETISSDGIEYLKNSKNSFDWIYVDPSRRHDVKGKVFFLKDCLPNIPQELDILFAHSNNILIKTSPLLDISAGIDELNHVKSVHIIAVENEVKELLWILEKDYDSNIRVETINLRTNNDQTFNFNISDESNNEATYSVALNYLFEPNAAILKAGAFNSVALQLHIFKLHKHSHLYTSEHFIEFPGRSFKIEQIIPYSKKAIRRLSVSKANITTRNFPESVEHIRKKYEIKDGGSIYLFFTTDFKNKKVVLMCSKIS